MASLNSDKHGTWRVQFVGRDGCRPTIRLGAIPKRQAESIKLKIEALVSAMTTGMRPDDETQRWVQGLHDDLHAKVAAAGLVEPRGGTRLGSFVADYIARREVELKFNTLRNLRKSETYLVEFFGRDRDLREITAGDAADFRTWLLGKGLGENSVRGFVKRAKHFFSVAIEHELLARNPFAKVPSTVKANPQRFYFVSREEAEAVLDACGSAQWRVIFALARYGGLRCPSEVMSLRWADVDWERGRLRVPSPKTEKNPGGASRVIPLFPELEPILRDAFDEAAEGDEFVVTHLREEYAKVGDGDASLLRLNLGQQMSRIIRRAGLEVWPKLFQNLRSTRETELAERFPLHVVCRWIGNSEPVATKHYLQLTDDHFEQALTYKAGGEATQNPTQQASETVRRRSREPAQEKSQVPAVADTCDDLFVNAEDDSFYETSPRGVEPLFSG